MPESAALPPPPELSALRSAGDIALFLDFDGTLVDLAPTPDAILVPDGLAQQLGALSARLDGRLALISGRAIEDIERHAGALAIARAGSHGSDCRLADGTALGQAPESLTAPVLEAIAGFARDSGFALEDKPHGAALHYRHDDALEASGLTFAADLADRHGLAVKRGKSVIEFVAQGANKGSAVEAFMAQPLFANATPVFIGDDVTDEDGFAAAIALGGFGILVGDRGPTVARYRLHDPANVYQWLEL